MNLIKEDEKHNKILSNSPELINSDITFNGENNILICEENVILNGTTLLFNGNNSIIYLSSNYNHYQLFVNIFNNSVLFFDENNYFNSKLYMILSEEKNIFIGKDNLFAHGIWIRLADPHLIYDIATMERINLTEDIYIGDHVWIAQEALILRGTEIGSGSIIGAKSVMSGKKVESNSIWAGNPPQQIKRNIFFDGRTVHRYTKKETEESMNYLSDKWIYSNINSGSGFEQIREITNTENMDLKIEKILELRNNKNKNRFYI